MIKFTTFSILFLLFIVPVLMLLLIKMVPSGDQPGYNWYSRVSIYGERELTQEFLSKYKNMTAVATSIKNPNLRNKKDINFNLYDENNNLIRTSKLNGFNIGDGDFMKFVFEPVIDSEGKQYKFIISAPTTNADEYIDLFLTDPTKEVLSYTYDNETKKGGIPMVTFHKSEDIFTKIKDIYTNIFSKL